MTGICREKSKMLCMYSVLKDKCVLFVAVVAEMNTCSSHNEVKDFTRENLSVYVFSIEKHGIRLILKRYFVRIIQYCEF